MPYRPKPYLPKPIVHHAGKCGGILSAFDDVIWCTKCKKPITDALEIERREPVFDPVKRLAMAAVL